MVRPTQKTDPLHGHALCYAHASKFNPRRSGLNFFYIPPGSLSSKFLCGRCAPGIFAQAGLMVSQDSLERGLVTFMKNAAFDLRNLEEAAIPLERLKSDKRA